MNWKKLFKNPFKRNESGYMPEEEAALFVAALDDCLTAVEAIIAQLEEQEEAETQLEEENTNEE